MALLIQLKRDMRRASSPKKAKASQWFFKTDPGQYGHGDRFLGITVPEQRALARKYREMPLSAVLQLLRSPFHEHRLTALFLLVDQYQRGDERTKEKVVTAYLKHIRQVNNWDLVDSSAGYILGDWLVTHPRQVLFHLVKSKNLWERRIAIIATQALIRRGEFADTIKLSTHLLGDDHDLMHKAAGWMLREVGNRDRAVLVGFLKKYATKMPRTMLRYAIEKFPERERRAWLSKK